MIRTEQSTLEHESGVAILTMRRPDRRNALSLSMMRELEGALVALGSDAGVRAVILAGEGAAFSSGHDLRELHDRPESAYREIFDQCVALMAAIERIPKPVIAEVGALATAAGAQLVAACDLAVASTEARFATPGVRIGLFCSTPMVALSRSIGRKRAMEMLLTGDPIDAQTALDWGLINRVVAPGALRAETLAFAKKIGEASRRVVALGKAAFYAQIDLPTAGAYAYTKEVMTLNAADRDAHEGIDAFFAKRRPEWDA